MSAQNNPTTSIASALSFAQMYVSKCQFALTPLRPFSLSDANSKAPSLSQWQAAQNWITSEEQCRTYFLPKGKGFTKQPIGEPGVGLVHAGSGTMALDIDDYDATKALFDSLGIDLGSVLVSTAQITRGDATRAKGIFLLPDSAGAVDLRKLVVQYNGKVAFEFRGGPGTQDALPPTVHPSGNQFQWVNFNGDRGSFATLPDELYALWQDPQPFESLPDYKVVQAKKNVVDTTPWKPSRQDLLVLERAGDVAYLLENAGYTRHTDGRFSKPGSNKAGMVVYPDGRAWSFHGSEPLYFGKSPHPLGPFDVFVGLMALEQGKEPKDVEQEALQALLGTSTGSAPPAPPPDDPVDVEVLPDPPEKRGPLWLAPEAGHGDDPTNWPDIPTISTNQGTMSIEPTPVNCDRVLRQHSGLVNVFRFDDFTGQMYVVDPPWAPGTVDRFHKENTPTELSVYLGTDSLYKRLSHQLLQRALMVYGTKRRVDSLANQVKLLPEWDRKPRIDTWLMDYCGADDTPANRIIGRKFLLGMIARALKPGCKMDNMVIMEGREGRGKSTLFDVLAGRLRFSDKLEHRLCTEQHLTLRGDDTKASEKMQGAWLAELPELSSFSKADRLLLVSFISRKEDAYRTPYDVGVTSKPRRIVLVGTTNETGDYLENAEGNRRFWPVTIEKVKIDLVARDRDQLLAEAYHAFVAQESWWMEETQEVEAGLRELQKSRTSENPLDAYGKQALVLMCKALLENGRTDDDRWTSTDVSMGFSGLFFSSSEMAQAISSNGLQTNPVQVGRWLARVGGWARGKRYAGGGSTGQRYAHAPTVEWLDANVPGWKNTKLGRKYE